MYLLFARDAPRAVILLRGPSNWYHVVRWHTADDSFEHGAWFRGRIYEERCDLSPDGELLVYFALQGSRWGTGYGGSWTAVSRAPWLHALTLWPQGDTWSGGGYFTGDRGLVLQTCVRAPHPLHPLNGLQVEAGPRRRPPPTPEGAPRGWCGVDQEGKAILAWAGRLYRHADGGDMELADFNGLNPSPEPAPDWARLPLSTRRAHRRRERRLRLKAVRRRQGAGSGPSGRAG